MSEDTFDEEDIIETPAASGGGQVLVDTLNINDLSLKNLGKIPHSPSIDDGRVKIAHYFLRDFETTRKYKTKEKNLVTKQVHFYLEALKRLITADIKIIYIDYTHFIDFIASYEDKVQKIIDKYGFPHPLIEVAKLDKQEQIELGIFMYSKKLLSFLEGPKISEFLTIMKDAAIEALKEDVAFDLYSDPQTKKEFMDMHIAIKNFPNESEIHQINSDHLNRGLQIKGNLVSYDEKIRVAIIKSYWNCSECQQDFGMRGSNRPQRCPLCKEKGNFLELHDMFETEDYIFIKVQQHINSDNSQVGVTDMIVKVEGKNLISYFYSNMKPASIVKITGIVKLSEDRTNRNNPNERILQLQAITIEIEGENTITQYNERLLDIIRTRVNARHIEDHFSKLKRSICTHLYGQDIIKLGILMMVVGAEPMINFETRNRIRGDINILLVGDSSQGKSDYGIFIPKILPQSIRTIGGSSTTTKAALTTSVDMINGVNVITFGVLPQCDNRGVAIVDELDKRGKEDFEILSYPMDDNQTIPTHKRGLHHEVNARCPVLLIGNPSKKQGKWDVTKSIYEQTNFASWLLSRVDLVFVMYDDGNMERKAAMVDHMSKTRSHMVIESDFDKNYKNKIYSEISVEKIEHDLSNNRFEGAYDTEYLRHEIHYLRTTYKPVLKPGSPADKMLKKNYLKYASITTPSDYGEGEVVHDNMMDTRKYNSLERLAKAAARCRRHHFVEEEDMQTALDLMTYSIATLLPQAKDENKVDKGNPLDFIARNLSTDKMKSTMIATFVKNRDTVAKNLRRKFNNLNKILIMLSNRPCEDCKGKGVITDLEVPETCLSCKGKRYFENYFTYNDLEMQVLKAGIMNNSKEVKRVFNDYFTNKIIKGGRGSASYTLALSPEGIELAEFTENYSNDLADKMMQDEFFKAFGTEMPMENVRPTRQGGDE